MNNSLEVRVDQIEALFEENPNYNNSNTMVKSHIVSTLGAANYQELKKHKDTYHRISENKIDVFGFKYDQKDQLYHVQFDNYDQTKEFLDLSEYVNDYDLGFDVFLSTAVSCLIGAGTGAVTASVLDFSSSAIVSLAFAGAIAGAIGGAMGSSAILNSDLQDQSKKLKSATKEITFGLDAIKSAVGGYLNE